MRVEAARSSAGWSVNRVDAVPTTYDKYGRAARLLGGERGDADQVAWWAATMARISAPYDTVARPAAPRPAGKGVSGGAKRRARRISSSFHGRDG